MQLKNLSISFGTQEVFSNINLVIPTNEKIGIVGVNGAGKTTLFKIIMGILEPDNGRVIFQNGERVEWLPQVISDEVSNMDISVFDYLMQGRPIDKLNRELQKLYDRIAVELDNQDELFKLVDKVQKKLDYWDSYSAESTLLKIIAGMNIEDDLLYKKLSELSGGQKSKVAFARLLYSNPEIMLLDEPTNHLDVTTKDYVTNYLKYYKGTILVISHDVDFLNKITTKTLFIDKRTKSYRLFNGNYDFFKKVQESYEANLIRQAEVQQQEEDKLRAIITKYASASGKRKKMAQDREKKLEKLLEDKIEVVTPNKKVNLQMEMNRESSNMPLQVQNLCFRYDVNSKKNIINNLSFNIYKGEKFLIVGENGVGKSTLLKLLTGKLVPISGEIIIGSKTDIGYYAQELEILDNTKTLLENFEGTGMNQRQIRSLLGRFLFYGDDVFKKVGILSPGERSRVALAKLSVSGANMLFLDEPTNHLDPETQNLIAEVFKTFNGTMIVVSHNPEFVDHLGVERTLTLPSGEINYYDRDIVEQYHTLNKKKTRRDCR